MLCLRKEKKKKQNNSFTNMKENSFHCFVKKAIFQIVCQLHMPVDLVLGIMNFADHHHHSNSRKLCLIFLSQFKRIDCIPSSKQCNESHFPSFSFSTFFTSQYFKLAIMSYQVQ
jgi:hypothetical protein